MPHTLPLRLTFLLSLILSFFFFNDTATTEIYTLSLHDALPISLRALRPVACFRLSNCSTSSSAKATSRKPAARSSSRSEEHTSELQSPCNLVCRLLLEKKKKNKKNTLNNRNTRRRHRDHIPSH